jgi:hypothetical protein
MTADEAPRPRRTVDVRLVLVLVGGLSALVLAFGGLWVRAARKHGVTLTDVLRDPALKRELLARFAQNGAGEYDSHPDPSVARVMLWGERSYDYGKVQVNAKGMREREYELPKPAGTTRVVLLGDSFVFGMKGPQDVRLGVRLEQFLREHSKVAGPIEVLHLGIPSWSLDSECAYLRRQLFELQPDLVLHVTCSNDLDDVCGVRGFGVLATFAPLVSERADSMLYQNFPSLTLGIKNANFLCNGFEYESRTRFEAARRAVLGLVADLGREETPVPYLLVSHWFSVHNIFHEQIGRYLAPEQQLYIPKAISDDLKLQIKGDGHWNAAGHERMARLLFGTIRARNLLPKLALEPWPEVEEEAASEAQSGWEEAQLPITVHRLQPALEPATFDDSSGRQIHGGVDKDGLVSPFAALVLGRPVRATNLRLSGSFLPDRVLAKKTVRVFVEEFELDPLTIEPGATIEESRPLPAETRGRIDLGVRFECDDFVYRGQDLRHCVVFLLKRIALE